MTTVDSAAGTQDGKVKLENQFGKTDNYLNRFIG